MGTQEFCLPPEWIKAAEQFNQQHYWEAHETLETIWLHASDPQKTFLQGIIQTAAGLHHVMNSNYKGAHNLLGYALEKLHRISKISTFQAWMDLDTFIQETEAALTEVDRLGADKIHQFCPNKLPTLLIPKTS